MGSGAVGIAAKRCRRNLWVLRWIRIITISHRTGSTLLSGALGKKWTLCLLCDDFVTQDLTPCQPSPFGLYYVQVQGGSSPTLTTITAHLIMTNAHTPITDSEVPDLIVFRIVKHVASSNLVDMSTIIQEIDRIDVGKTEKNTHDEEELILFTVMDLVGEFSKGIRYDQLIVVKVGTVYKLIDGFNRVSALKTRKQESWVI